MEEVSKCLKPGGLAIFIDGDTELLHRDMVTVLPMAMLDHEIRRDCSESEDSFMDSEPRTRADGSWVQRFLYGTSTRFRSHSIVFITTQQKSRMPLNWEEVTCPAQLMPLTKGYGG